VIRVLIVDDDPFLLKELRSMVTTLGALWEIELAPSGEKALEYLEKAPFDVVVADMMMPGMNGAELLAIVRDTYPETMRICMSGNTDIRFTSRLVPQAQQFLHKPFSPQVVISMVERASELGRHLYDPELKKVLGGITDLPHPPQTIVRLNALLDSPDSDIDEVVEVVESDMALTVRLFQLVNSASYGLTRSIQEVREAVMYLGLSTVRNLAVSISIFKALAPDSPLHAEAIEELHAHGQQVAGVARQLVLVREQSNEAFVSGLLHDVGLMAVVSYMPQQYRTLHEVAERNKLPLSEIELDIVGAKHADLGAYLLNLWGLPFNVVEAVARHHDAMLLPSRNMDATHAVCIADTIVNSQNPDRLLPEIGEAGLDTTYLGELGVLERVAGLISVGADR